MGTRFRICNITKKERFEPNLSDKINGYQDPKTGHALCALLTGEWLGDVVTCITDDLTEEHQEAHDESDEWPNRCPRSNWLQPEPFPSPARR